MKITLKEKKLKSGMSTLYIEFYKGMAVADNRKRTHLRDFKYLKLYQFEKPKLTSEKKNNKENLELAESTLAIHKADYAQGKYGLKNNIKAKNQKKCKFFKFLIDSDYLVVEKKALAKWIYLIYSYSILRLLQIQH